MGGACCIQKRKTHEQSGFSRRRLVVPRRHTLTTHDSPEMVSRQLRSWLLKAYPCHTVSDKTEGTLAKLGYKPRSAKMLMKRDHDWREWGTHPLAYWQEIPPHRDTIPPPSIPTPDWTMHGNAGSLWTRKAVPLCLTPALTLPPSASPTSFAENVASQATSEGTPPAHCLRYHLRTTPPRMPRYHLRTTPPRMRYHLRTPPRTRQHTHSIGSWPRSQPFSGGVRVRGSQ